MSVLKSRYEYGGVVDVEAFLLTTILVIVQTVVNRWLPLAAERSPPYVNFGYYEQPLN
jgi:hypothetical protein